MNFIFVSLTNSKNMNFIFVSLKNLKKHGISFYHPLTWKVRFNGGYMVHRSPARTLLFQRVRLCLWWLYQTWKSLRLLGIHRKKLRGARACRSRRWSLYLPKRCGPKSQKVSALCVMFFEFFKLAKNEIHVFWVFFSLRKMKIIHVFWGFLKLAKNETHVFWGFLSLHKIVRNTLEILLKFGWFSSSLSEWMRYVLQFNWLF